MSVRWSPSDVDEWAELEAYLGEDFSADDAREASALVAQEFNRYDDLTDFYRSSGAYLYDLTQFSLTGTKDPYRALIRLLTEPGAKILDYGCGIGSDGLRLVQDGYDVTFADFDNPSTAYLRWRLARRCLSSQVLDVERLPAGLRFDLAYSFDVLEHVEDPVGFLERLEGMASIVAVNFIIEEHSDEFPMHFTHDWAALLERTEREHTLIFDSFLYPNSQLVVYAVGKVDPRPLVSVVMPTRDRAALLERVLGALSDQTLPASSFEVLAVDDGSVDETPAVLERSPLVTQRLSGAGGGPAAARNLGLEAASAPLILFLDDDVVPEPDLIEQHLLFHLRAPAHEEAALGYVSWPAGETTPFMRRIVQSGELFAWDRVRTQPELDFWLLYTCNVSLKTALLGRERFDERFPHAAYEDVELAYRLTRRAGMRLRFLPAAVGIHHDRKEFGSFKQRQERAGASAVYFAQKHPELSGALRVDAPLDPAAAGLRAAQVDAAVKALEAIDLRPLSAVGHGSTTADEVVSGWLDALYGEGLALAYLRGVAAHQGQSDRPRSADEWHREGLRAYELGRWQDAAEAMREAIALERTVERINDLAVITTALGDHVAARRMLEECLALAPEDRAARQNLAALLRLD